MAAKVSGSNFFDKLKEYAQDAEVADEFALRIVSLFENVTNYHENKGDSAEDSASVTADVGGK